MSHNQDVSFDDEQLVILPHDSDVDDASDNEGLVILSRPHNLARSSSESGSASTALAPGDLHARHREKRAADHSEDPSVKRSRPDVWSERGDAGTRKLIVPFMSSEELSYGETLTSQGPTTTTTLAAIVLCIEEANTVGCLSDILVTSNSLGKGILSLPWNYAPHTLTTIPSLESDTRHT